MSDQGQGDLFTAPSASRADVPHPDVSFHRGLFAGFRSLARWRGVLPLQQRVANMYGKRLPVPRLESWHGTRSYAFGGRVEEPQPWPDALVALRLCVEAATGEGFDSCFVNLYRSGADHIPWHADEEPWIGPVIASVTFGAPRRFVMKHRATGTKHEWPLGDGDLFVMRAGVQAAWLHSVPATKGAVGERINMTFRQTVEVPRGR